MPDLSLMRNDATKKVQAAVASIALAGDWKELRTDVEALCNDFLILAAASLFADYKPEMFFLNLCRCGENWRRFAVLSRNEYQRELSLLENTPILAALAAQSAPLLERLRHDMPKQYQAGDEYEDQFHATWLWLLLSLNNVSLDKEVQAHLEALESCEKEPVRTTLFKALLNMDELGEEDFWGEFETALYARDEYINEQVQANAYIVTLAPHQYIWYEGLVWLRLAAMNGYKNHNGAYKLCPTEALQSMPIPYNNDWIILSSMSL